MKKVCLILKSKNPEAKQAIKKARGFLIDKKYQVFTSLNKTILKQGLKWVMAFGGDGAVLHTANKIAADRIPLIGVNFGHKGYLCQIPKEELLKALKTLDSKNFSINSYTRIRARVIQRNEIKKEIDALNEIVVGGINRAVWLKLKIRHNNQNKMATVIGDGIIFATQIGSTAYNLYAGGPVLLGDVFSVVACNALFESNYFLPNTRAFVVPANARFEVSSLRGGQHLPYVVADGQRDYRLQKGDKVIIDKSPLVTKLIKLKNI